VSNLTAAHDEGALARRQILGYSEAALRKADAFGLVPTPLDQVTAAVGLHPVIDIGELPDDIAARKPKALSRVLGAIVFPAKTAFVDLSQHMPRARLTHAHEIGHRIIPWHEGAFRLDDHETLRGQTADALEAEAFLAGGHLLFQGRQFVERAFSLQVSMNSAIAMAEYHGASIHATIRYYALHAPYNVAVLVAGQFGTSSVPVYDSVESPTFRRQFGPFNTMVGSRLALADESVFGRIAEAARRGTTVPSTDVTLADLRGDGRHFLAEAFFNQFNVFVMVTERRAARLGRRVRVQAG
jgi:hypothetical protein